MPLVSPVEVVRQFRENGLKLLLHDAANVRDLLTLRDPDRAARIDFARLTIDPTSYVAADYRHLASDLVLRVRYRTRRGGRRRTLTLYILIEHQSEPDLLMILRVLEYLVQIYKAQVRTDTRGRRLADDFRLQPVLPIVFYTGERRWEALTTFTDLVEGGAEDFADVLPQLRPLFLNLSTISAPDLETAGGALGWILELLARRHASAEEFQTTAKRVVDHLEGMAEAERERWLLFLSYIDAMTYHDRGKSEHEALQAIILDSIRSDARRKEVQAMWRSAADELEEKGRREGRKEGRMEGRQEGKLLSRQQVLVRLLRQRFGRVPRSVELAIRATTDVARLDGWLDAVVTAERLADVDIAAPGQ